MTDAVASGLVTSLGAMQESTNKLKQEVDALKREKTAWQDKPITAENRNVG